MDDELNQVLQEVIQVVNFIKARPMKHRLFTLLCNEMGVRFEGLLLHSNVRCLSRGAVLNRVYELRREGAEFLSSKSISWQIGSPMQPGSANLHRHFPPSKCTESKHART